MIVIPCYALKLTTYLCSGQQWKSIYLWKLTSPLEAGNDPEAYMYMYSKAQYILYPEASALQCKME